VVDNLPGAVCWRWGTESVYTLGLMLQVLALVGALVLVPLVVRRLGWDYGACVPTPLLASFPCSAVGGGLLVSRSRPRLVWLLGSGTLLLLMSSAYARGYYVG
jgi:hypothetical protein